MGPEATIERPAVKLAKDQGWKVRKLSFIGTRGAPDRLFGRAGRAVLIEFKAPGEEPTIQQSRRHAELREAFGFEVHVCDSVDRAKEILDLL